MLVPLRNHGRYHLAIRKNLPHVPPFSPPTRLVQRRRQSSRTDSTRSDAPKTIFSGIQPTGIPHVGNYLGALQKWVELQDDAATGTKLIYSIVDLHALTIAQDPALLRQRRQQMLAMLLAVGLDPNRSTIFYQSMVGSSKELYIKEQTGHLQLLGSRAL